MVQGSGQMGELSARRRRGRRRHLEIQVDILAVEICDSVHWVEKWID